MTQTFGFAPTLFGLLCIALGWGTAIECSAQDSNEKLRLLKLFQSEFVAITPGTEKFPKAPDSEPANATPSYPYSISKYEVTQELWESVTGENPSRWKGNRNSVEMLDLKEAADFCTKLTEALRSAKLIAPDQIVRLPSEQEWEFACAAGNYGKYSFGDDASKLGDFGWFHGNAAGNDPPVGAKKPNNWELYDMHGYLTEWCLATTDDNVKRLNSSDWAKLIPADKGVARSGSWKDDAGKLETRTKFTYPVSTRDDALGLRCVLVKVSK